MTARAVEGVTSLSTDLLPMIQKVFEPVAMGTVATSAAEARRLGYLRATDRISMNRDRLIADAKDLALQRVDEGYQRPQARTQIPVGGDAVLAALKIGIHLMWRGGRISDHDKLIGTKLATIMAGGALPHPAFVTEQHLLDLEREAFLSLCGQPRTLERIKHMLTTGKPLRN
jgi:3-hydroxyacyl-CoA dehydrogenase